MCWAVTPSIYGLARHPINPPVKIVSAAATLREEHKDEITRGSAGGGVDILFFFFLLQVPRYCRGMMEGRREEDFPSVAAVVRSAGG